MVLSQCNAAVMLQGGSDIFDLVEEGPTQFATPTTLFDHALSKDHADAQRQNPNDDIGPSKSLEQKMLEEASDPFSLLQALEDEVLKGRRKSDKGLAPEQDEGLQAASSAEEDEEAISDDAFAKVMAKKAGLPEDIFSSSSSDARLAHKTNQVFLCHDLSSVCNVRWGRCFHPALPTQTP